MKKILDKLESAIQFIDSIIEKVTRIMWIAGGFCIAIMAFIVVYGVVTRYVFRSPDSNAYSITCILMVFCVTLSLSYTQKERKHLRLDLLDNILPKALSELLKNIAGPVLGLFFCIVLAWKSWDSAFNALAISEITRDVNPIPTFPLKFVIALFIIILCLVITFQILRYIFELRRTHKEKEVEKWTS